MKQTHEDISIISSLGSKKRYLGERELWSCKLKIYFLHGCKRQAKTMIGSEQWAEVPSRKVPAKILMGNKTLRSKKLTAQDVFNKTIII